MPGHGSLRTRWAAIGAAIAVSLGGGITLGAHAIGGSGGGDNTYTPITPCRLLDTRGGSNNVGLRTTPLGPGDTYEATVHGTNGNCTIPTNATGIATNTTVLNGTAASFLTLFPANTNRPLASNLNWTAGQPATPNQVTVGLSPDGKVRIYNDRGTVNVIVDIVGIYTDLGTHRVSLSFPAQGLGLPSSPQSVVEREYGGLNWAYDSSRVVGLHMFRPSDFAGTGMVTLTVSFRPFQLVSSGNVRFTVFPQSYAQGDTWLPDQPHVSNPVAVTSGDHYQYATVSIPASRMSNDMWQFSIRRDTGISNPWGGNIVVFSVAVEYDAYR